MGCVGRSTLCTVTLCEENAVWLQSASLARQTRANTDKTWVERWKKRRDVYGHWDYVGWFREQKALNLYFVRSLASPSPMQRYRLQSGIEFCACARSYNLCTRAPKQPTILDKIIWMRHRCLETMNSRACSFRSDSRQIFGIFSVAFAVNDSLKRWWLEGD